MQLRARGQQRCWTKAVRCRPCACCACWHVPSCRLYSRAPTARASEAGLASGRQLAAQALAAASRPPRSDVGLECAGHVARRVVLTHHQAALRALRKAAAQLGGALRRGEVEVGRGGRQPSGRARWRPTAQRRARCGRAAWRSAGSWAAAYLPHHLSPRQRVCGAVGPVAGPVGQRVQALLLPSSAGQQRPRPPTLPTARSALWGGEAEPAWYEARPAVHRGTAAAHVLQAEPAPRFSP